MTWSRSQQIHPNFYGYRLLCNNEEIDAQQKEHFFLRIHDLYEKSLVLYRGDHLQSLYKAYKVSSKRELDQKLFVLGFKGRSYSEIERLVSIEDSSNEVFELIFRTISRILDTDYDSPIAQKSVNDFKRLNPSVANFFVSSNQVDFIKRLPGINNCFDRTIIRDHYYTVLHHFGRSKYPFNSFFISTSKSFSVSRKFSGKGGKGKIISVCWIHEIHQNCMYNYSLSFSQAGRKLIKEDTLKKYNLPEVVKVPYPNQYEVSLKGGIFPHYMLGYLDYEHDEFHINPALFNVNNNWVEDGFDVDQTNFQEVLGQTSLTGSFAMNEEGYYTEERR